MTEKITEDKIYGPGSVFFEFVAQSYYEIIEGKIKKKYTPYYYSSHVTPKKVIVQQLKFIKNKTEYIPIDNFKNREFYEEDHYILVKDDDKKPFLYTDDIFFDRFYKKNTILKIISHKKKRKLNFLEKKINKYNFYVKWFKEILSYTLL